MFKKVLIANRGEIAVRVIRACQELNISTVAVYSQADREALHVKLADEAICIGPPPALESYLSGPSIISAAEITGAEAVHPGYGFLAENTSFVEMCEAVGLVFIGPGAESMQLLGDKAKAKELIKKAGLPVIPGSEGVIKDEKEALQIAGEIGFPVIVKAAAGGGGKGMRIVQSEEELLSQLQLARTEANSAFGDGSIYMEKYLEKPKHIEVQVLADQQGNVIHLGERDCSIQRRHQKLIEEAPSPALNSETRAKVGEMAVKAARAANYLNAGTFEFLMDKEGNFYFMEANTRLQVEHTITEMVTGIDIVKAQILIAAGEKIPFKQEEIEWRGHSIEFRINAEDPNNNFLPRAGKITNLCLPGGMGVRVDAGIYQGWNVPPYYDSLLAKLIVWGKNREEAIGRGKRALKEFVIEGVPTTIPFHLQVLNNAFYLQGEVYTDFLARRILNEQR